MDTWPKQRDFSHWSELESEQTVLFLEFVERQEEEGRRSGWEVDTIEIRAPKKKIVEIIGNASVDQTLGLQPRALSLSFTRTLDHRDS